MEARSARKEEVASLCERLDEGIKGLRDSGAYRKYLLAMSRFRTYSYRNTMLIQDQFPKATMVASYGVWKKLGRFVKKGEKSIRILAPITYKASRSLERVDPATGLFERTPEGNVRTEEREVRVAGFRPVSVFDISQTDGEPLPAVAHPLEGGFEGAKRLGQAVAQAAGVQVRYDNLRDNASGMVDTILGVVTLQKGMSEQQELKTLIHEAAHYRMHPPGNTLPRGLRELQAESVAFVVSAYFGLDTSQYSIGYVAGWAEELSDEEIRSSLDFISRHASALIGEVEQILGRDRSLETLPANDRKTKTQLSR